MGIIIDWTNTNPFSSIHPLAHKYVRIVAAAIIAVRAEDKMLAVGREHRESVKAAIVRDALQPGAVKLYYIKIKWEAPLVLIV